MKVFEYTDIGKKENNEDAIGYNNNCFVVCDGVGGSTKGEKASKTVVEYILKNFKDYALNKEVIDELMEKTQNTLNILVEKEPELNGMATTIASVFLMSNGIFSVHVGDSRVYFIKPKQELFWQTWDHSVVGNLVKSGDLNREEARTHPMNNQILKAFKGNLDRDTVSTEIHFLSDLEAGDICFLCTDGVSETFSDFELIALLCNSEKTIGEKLEFIQKRCQLTSKDNHSSMIIEFDEADLINFNNYPTEWQCLSSLENNQN